MKEPDHVCKWADRALETAKNSEIRNCDTTIELVSCVEKLKETCEDWYSYISDIKNDYDVKVNEYESRIKELEEQVYELQSEMKHSNN